MLVTKNMAALCIASHADVCRGPVLHFFQGGARGEILVSSENDCVSGKSIYKPRDEEIEVLLYGMTARGMSCLWCDAGARCDVTRTTN